MSDDGECNIISLLIVSLLLFDDKSFTYPMNKTPTSKFYENLLAFGSSLNNNKNDTTNKLINFINLSMYRFNTLCNINGTYALLFYNIYGKNFNFDYKPNKTNVTENVLEKINSMEKNIKLFKKNDKNTLIPQIVLH